MISSMVLYLADQSAINLACDGHYASVIWQYIV